MRALEKAQVWVSFSFNSHLSSKQARISTKIVRLTEWDQKGPRQNCGARHQIGCTLSFLLPSHRPPTPPPPSIPSSMSIKHMANKQEGRWLQLFDGVKGKMFGFRWANQSSWVNFNLCALFWGFCLVFFNLHLCLVWLAYVFGFFANLCSKQ